MPRRAGQIIARGERTWLVRVFQGCDAVTKKRRYLNKTVHGLRRDAQEALNRALVERDRCRGLLPANTTLADYCTHWLETAAKPGVRPRTYTDYAGLLTRHVVPVIGRLPLGRPKPLEIQSVYTAMHRNGLSSRTMIYVHAVLHMALKQAVKWRLLPDNPAASVDLPRRSRRQMSVLTLDQARLLAKACEGEPYGTLFLLALTTGMRPSEYLALEWKDIDWTTGTVRITKTLERLRGGAWRFADTKRAGSRRVVKLQDSVLKRLDQDRWQLPEPKATDLLFTDDEGEPLHRRSLIRWHFKPLLRRLDLPDIRLSHRRRAHQGRLGATWACQRRVHARCLLPRSAARAGCGRGQGRGAAVGNIHRKDCCVSRILLPDSAHVGTHPIDPRRGSEGFRSHNPLDPTARIGFVSVDCRLPKGAAASLTRLNVGSLKFL